MAWGGRQRAMETTQHWDRLAKNQPAEITMFQISEVQESPAFNGRLSFLTLRDSNLWSFLRERASFSPPLGTNWG